ncbi:putative phosphatidylinositol-4-phosphate 5-kinase [Planoprotostelium fungivorum]|uniref:Putative phosphatidylinositol-4-phosphate 5-kinase n=1 Tax=Planoprotostelium fungivorum TaxID=1890364 RepID=A0A2P6NMD2_9EUKA|nr:putative phosphatidylinositol-4-phosphate 5-kinase [Planoprotostelium fungivorum]
MVVCSPFSSWRGLYWTSYEKDDKFTLQGHPWGTFRILLTTFRLVYTVATSESREEIQSDWETIHRAFDDEVKRVGSSVWSENHTKVFFENLSNLHNKSNKEENQKRLSVESPPANMQEDTKSFFNDLVSAVSDVTRPPGEVIKLIEAHPKLINSRTTGGITLLQVLAISPRGRNQEEVVEIAKSLINRGARVNAKDNQGWTTLHCACYRAQLAFVQLLVDRSANVLALTMDKSIGASFLVQHDFSEHISENVLQLKLLSRMLDCGVPVNFQNGEGNSLLHQAVGNGGSKDITLFLLGRGASVNITNDLGQTAILLAVFRCRQDIIELLLEHGADPSIPDVNGDSPIALAQSLEVCDLMREAENRQKMEEKMSSTPNQDSNNTSPTRDRSSSGYFLPATGGAATVISSCSGSLNTATIVNEALLGSVCSSNSERRLKQKSEVDLYNSSDVENRSVKSDLSLSPTEMSIMVTLPREEEPQAPPEESEKLLACSQSVADAFEGWLSTQDLDLLYRQFNAMDLNQSGEISEGEFASGIGSIMSDPVLSSSLFRVLDLERDGHVDFTEYAQGLAVLMRGSPTAQLELAYQLFEPGEDGRVQIEKFRRVVESIRVSLGAITLEDMEKFIENTFGMIPGALERGSIDVQEYVDMATRDPLYISSLGLVSNRDITQFSTLQYAYSSPRRGALISFGNEYWNMAYSMFFGIRVAVGEAASEFEMNPRELEPKDFTLEVQYPLGRHDVIVLRTTKLTRCSICKSVGLEWNFRDYSPAVFHNIRQVLNIKPKHYMFSLGPEKILGNLLLGNLGSLCSLVSTGKSGSFFFRTSDGKYLIKTLPYEEVLFLIKILPSYYDHLSSHTNTMLTRFCGLHSIKHGGEKEIYFVVMCNLFDSILDVHEQYDLKGSTVGRSVDADGIADISQIAFKDLDYASRKRRVRVGPSKRAALLEQLEVDAQWLESNGICDYSFLIGYHFVSEGEAEEFGMGKPQREGKRRFSSVRSFFQQDVGGLVSVDGLEVYFIGIIDILTAWDYKKMTEHLTKSYILQYPSDQLSAIRPSDYRVRFQRYISSIID